MRKIVNFTMRFLLCCSLIFSLAPMIVHAEEAPPLSGEGSTDQPYLIQSKEDLQLMASLIEEDEQKAAASYRLTQDVSMEGVVFKGIGVTHPFRGEFDGGGFIIDDLHMTSTDNRIGLFSQLQGTVKNLTIGPNCSFQGNQYVGGIAGYSLRATLLNCATFANVEAVVSDAGGLIGQMNSGAILNCYARANVITGKETAGGLAGYSGYYNYHDQPSVIKNCYSASTVSSKQYFASAVGYDDPLYPTTYENVYYDYDLCASWPAGNNASASIHKKSMVWMQSYELVETLNEAAILQSGWNTWTETDDYPVYGAIHNELKDFMESIPDEPATMKDADTGSEALVLPISESGRYQAVLAGSDHKQVISLEGMIYHPVVEQKVKLIYDIYDTQKERNVTTLQRNVIKTIAGTHEIQGNACPSVVPGLREWSGGSGIYLLQQDARIIADDASQEAAQRIAQLIEDMTGIKLSVMPGNARAGDIVVIKDVAFMEELGEEGYYLQIDDKVTITAPTDTALYYGGVSITQILYQNHKAIPQGIARDYPAYDIRSGMIDVGRRFIPLDYIEEITKYMSWFKMNQIHLHINEDGGEYSSGFMIESKKYPQLNSNNGTYIWTQDAYRQFQKDAKLYGVDVVTEIDSPGHAAIFAKINPAIVNGSNFNLNDHYEESVALMQSIYDEYLDGDDPVFQSSVFHIGTDESSNSNEHMRRYINDMLEYVKQKDNIEEVRFWGNLSLYTGQTPVTNDATIQIWDSPDQRADEALEAGFDVLNSTSCMMYIVPGAGAGPIFPDYWNPIKLYDMWGGASDFTTHTLSDPYMIGNRNYYGEFDILKGNPQIKGAEFCIWNDSAGGISDFDIFSRARSFIAVLAEKTWFGDEDAYTNGEAFMQVVDEIDDQAPGANPARSVATSSSKVASYDFETVEDSVVKDRTGQYDAVLQNVGVMQEGDQHVADLQGNGSIALPFASLGFPYTVEFDIYLDGTQDEEATLFASEDCTFYLNYQGRGLGFDRGKYGFTFDKAIPENRWVHVLITSKAPHYPGVDDTTLWIDGAWYSAAKITGPGNQKSTTSLLGTEAIAQGIVGKLDNLTLYNAHIVDIDDIAIAHLDGKGTAEEPYLIASPQDMSAFAMMTSMRSYEGAFFEICEDIDMQDVRYTPAGQTPFAGTLDGKGHVISNLEIHNAASETGLFKAIEKGTVKNLGIASGSVQGTGRVGAIAGRVMYATIINCFNKAEVSGSADVGGLVGMYNNSYMGNCYNAGKVTGSSDGASFGGLVGSSNRSIDPSSESSIENAYNIGLVDGAGGRYVGSLIGYLETQDEYKQTYQHLFYLDTLEASGFGSFDGMEALSSESFIDGSLLQLLNNGKKDDEVKWVADSNGYPMFLYQLHLDTTALQQEIMWAKDYELDHYTTDSVQALLDAIKHAEDMLQHAESQNAIEEAQLALQDVQSKLAERASITLIQACRDKVSAIHEEEKEYSQAAFAPIALVLKDADCILQKADDLISKDQLQRILLSLTYALEEAEEIRIVDHQAAYLLEVIRLGNAALEEDLSSLRPNRVAILRQVLTTAQQLIDENDRDITLLREAALQVLDAMQKLYTIVDQENVIALLDSIQQLHADRYTMESWNDVQDAVQSAQWLLSEEGKNATTQQVEDVHNALLQAVANLKIILHKEALAYQMDLAQQMLDQAEQYVPSSIQDLAKALENAKVVYVNGRSQQEINEAINTLIQTLAKARLKPDKTVLLSYLKELAAMQWNAYPAASVKRLQEEIQAAEKIAADPESDKEQVEKAFLAVKQAVAQLENDKVGVQSVDAKMTGSKQQNTSKSNVADTGDESDPMIWFLWFLSAGLIILLKRKQQKY